MSWTREMPEKPFKPGDKVRVLKSAVSIDKSILGKYATVEYCTYKLVQVERNGIPYVFLPEELRKVGE